MMRTFLITLFTVAAFVATLGGFSSEALAGCPPGKVANQDTGGHCCWPGQAWSGSECVGKPTSCPDGFRYADAGQACELVPCPEGLNRTADKVHCCWPGQGWSSAKDACVGTPRCKRGYIIENNGCVAGPTIRDTDQDLMVDADDQCPELPEDPDGFQDEDGCPDEDNDEDGVVDTDDQCPMDAEDHDGFHDDDGCPDEDNDEDGLLDADDKCPDQPEEMINQGVEGADGCPDDDDGDGVSNADDQCPDALEDPDGFEDDDGCPEADNDNDGFIDGEDACANQPEDFDFFRDRDGCPDEDNDQDGIADASDRCPHELEDGEGGLPANGCRIPVAEEFAANWFPDSDYGNVYLMLVNVPTRAGGFTYVAPSFTSYNDWSAWGITFGLGGGTDHIEPEWDDGEAEIKETFGAFLGAHAGIYPLEWPIAADRDYSLLNPVIGTHFLLDGGEDAHVGAGLYLSNTITIGDWSFGTEYRGFGVASDGPHRDGHSLAFFIGLTTRNHPSR